MVKILYLGGFYWAEHSMLQSFLDNGQRVTFLIDPNDKNYRYHSCGSNHQFSELVFDCPRTMLEKHIEQNRPDVIIHRYYMGDPCMHAGSYAIARKFGIPFIRYAFETDNEDSGSGMGDNFDALMYAHNTAAIMDQVSTTTKPSFFYPYGVSGYERITDQEKTIGVGALGNPRSSIPVRVQNLRNYERAMGTINQKLNVYGTEGEWASFSPRGSVVVNPPFTMDESTEVINRHKVIINFESLPDTEGAYSHKMFQSLGCGVPTITRWKQSIEDLFGDHVIMVHDAAESAEIVDWLLMDEEYRQKIGRDSHDYIHDNFDWWKRLNKIFNQLGI